MKRLTPALTLILPAGLLLLTGASPLAAQQASRMPWQMHDGQGPQKLSAPHASHGDVAAYALAAIPAENDPGWVAAPNTDTIGFSRRSQLGGEYGCRQSADYTYFQTFLDVPQGVQVTQFDITFSGMDDGSRITVFNSAHPSGIVDPGSYVKLGGTGTANLAQYIQQGRNRIVITQVDDCCCGNNLNSASVVLNGRVVEAPPAPVVCNSSWGDVHVRGPDGLIYDYQGAGEFVAVKSNDGNVVVQARQETHPRNSRVSLNTALALNVNGNRVAFNVKPSPSLVIDGSSAALTADQHALSSGGKIERSGQQYVVRWPKPTSFVVCVRLHGSSHLDYGVSKPAGSQTTYSGFMGIIDGDPSNDLHTRGGQNLGLPASYEKLVTLFDSWCVTSSESLFSYPPGGGPSACGRQDQPLATRDLPHVAEARQACAAKGVTDPVLLDNCLTDVGATGDRVFADSAQQVQADAAAAPAGQPAPVVAMPGQYTTSTLVGQWIFYGSDGSLKERTGLWDDATLNGASLGPLGLRVTQSGWARSANYRGPEIGPKTLIAWLLLNDLANRRPSGSALTIDAINQDIFDAIVYGEQREDTWMAGSNYFVRTQTTDANPKTTQTCKVVKMAISYAPAGNQVEIKLYQDDRLATSYQKGPLARWTAGNAEALFGARHTLGSRILGYLDATILKAEIHNVALTAEQIAARGL